MGFELRDFLVLARHVLYHSSHTHSPINSFNLSEAVSYTTVLWHSKEFSKVSYLKLCKEFEGMIEKNSAQRIRFLEGGEFMENVLIRSPNFKSDLLGT
jgi:hypothetical protein